MSIKNYKIEIEQNDVKSRAATYIKSTINYKRGCDLEVINKLNYVVMISYKAAAVKVL